eukprot:4438485-Prymnesium_polylepis.1
MRMPSRLARSNVCGNAYLVACRTPAWSTTLACEGFAAEGLMSCGCREQCLEHGFASRALRSSVLC